MATAAAAPGGAEMTDASHVTDASDTTATGDLAECVRRALESADLAAVGELLDPNVTWGPPEARVPVCRNRRQVLEWYGRERRRGGRARVTEVVTHGDKLLVGLEVTGTEGALRQGGVTDRWQVLTVRGGRIVDIVGFPVRAEAAARAGLSS